MAEHAEQPLDRDGTDRVVRVEGTFATTPLLRVRAAVIVAAAVAVVLVVALAIAPALF